MSDQNRSSPLWELTLARLREFYREPGAVFWVFGFPVVMVIGLGLAFRDGEPQKPRIAIEQSAPAWITQSLEDDGFEPTQFAGDEGLAQLRHGKVDLLVEYADDSPRFRFDAARAEGQLARAQADDALQRARGRTDALTIAEQHVTEPGSRYVDFLLPGMIGLNLMGASMWGIGYNVIVQRKRRLLRRFAASPMRRTHFLLSYGLSRLVFLSVEVAALLAFGGLAFGVDVQGSYFAMIVVSIVGSMSFAALSLLVAARIESLEAANGWLNFIMLPMWLLSGSFFSYQRFPESLHPLIQVLPLTALNDALRAISTEGATLVSTWPQLVLLTLWGLASFALGLRFFRWQ
jgi:ABC-type multidrug transport system permease subunit